MFKIPAPVTQHKASKTHHWDISLPSKFQCQWFATSQYQAHRRAWGTDPLHLFWVSSYLLISYNTELSKIPMYMLLWSVLVTEPTKSNSFCRWRRLRLRLQDHTLVQAASVYQLFIITTCLAASSEAQEGRWLVSNMYSLSRECTRASTWVYDPGNGSISPG